MSETDWEERRELEERLAQGEGITVEDAQRLISDADAGQRHEAKLESIVKAMWDVYGIRVVDSTTDDDDGEVRVELIRAEPTAAEEVANAPYLGGMAGDQAIKE